MSGNPDFSMEEEERIAEEYVKAKLISSEHEPLLTTIPQVPTNFLQTNRRLCKPCMVSIGPYNLYERGLFCGDHKVRLLKSFLCRNSELRLEHCIQALMSLHRFAWQCYEESQIHLDNIPFDLPEFLENRMQKSKPECPNKMDKIYIRDPKCFVVLLLLDGCFILELFLKWLNEESDILFTKSMGQRLILSELLLFDNQIPFVVIEKLYDLVMRGPAAISTTALEPAQHALFCGLLAKFLTNEEPTSHPSPVTSWPKPIHHLLDLYHQFLLPTYTCCQDEKANHDPTAFPLWKHRLIFSITPITNQSGADQPPCRIPCATKLHEAGIKFSKKKSPINFCDFSFARGILEIPFLQFDENKQILFYSLVALEREKNWDEQIVTRYIELMNFLINTKADVQLLQSAGVIHDVLSTQQEAADFFDELARSSSFYTKSDYFGDLLRQMQRYYETSLERSIREYFNSFWATLSVISGMILFVLTMFQTFYAVYPYYRPR